MINPYLKFVVALLGAIAAALQTTYGTARWEPAITAAISALLVLIVPNTPNRPGNGS